MPEGEFNPFPPEHSFSPQLRAAMQEILAITRKYDIGGYVVLCAEQHVEIRTRFPTWSRVHIEAKNGGNEIRIKAKKDSTKDQENLSYTINMLTSLFEQPAQMAIQMDQLLTMLRKHIAFETRGTKGPDAPPWDFK